MSQRGKAFLSIMPAPHLASRRVEILPARNGSNTPTWQSATLRRHAFSAIYPLHIPVDPTSTRGMIGGAPATTSVASEYLLSAAATAVAAAVVAQATHESVAF